MKAWFPALGLGPGGLERLAGLIVRQGHVLAPCALLAAAIFLRVSGPIFIEGFRYKMFDLFNVLKPRPYRDVRVRVLDIDDESLARLGQWPWPRTKLAQIVSRLSGMGASAVAMDIVFAEPDRASLEFLVPTLPDDARFRPVRTLAKTLPGNDRIFADAIAGSRVVAGFNLTARSNGFVPQAKAGLSFAGDDPLMYLPGYQGAVVNIRPLEEAASGNGCLGFSPDQDGAIRRAPLLFRRGKAIYPSLALEALRVAQGAPDVAVKSSGASGTRSFGEHTGISRVKTGSWWAPTDGQGSLWVYYSRRDPRRSIPVWRFMEPGFPRDALKGAIVFIGASASGLGDLRATPLDPAAPGVEIHAQVAEQILAGDFVARPDWADGAEVVCLAAVGLALVFLLARLGAAWSALIGLSFLAAAAGLSWHAYVRWRLLLDPLYPCLVSVAVYLSSTTASFIRSEAERRRLILLDHLKDEFVSTVSHDLRGPVNAMIMVVDMMLRGSYGPLTDKQSRYLQMMKESGKKLTAFVTNILDAAKIRAGKMELHKAEVRAQEVLPVVVELFRLSASAKGLALDCEAAVDLPPIDADREKLEQVVNNLVGNAMKFTPSGGRISIKAEPEDGFVRFSVSDTGLGISPEDVPRLFQKFQQVDLAGQRQVKVSGTGLGLSICKTIVEAHGGRIWVESAKGAGSSFRFTIPRSEAPTGPAPAVGEEDGHGPC